MQEMPRNIPIRKKHKKTKKHFGFLYLFVCVFLIALAGLSYIVKSYSPDIDVSIGNNQGLTLNDSDMDTEIKTVDERLKWIQMEDEMPSAALSEKENVFDGGYIDDYNDETERQTSDIPKKNTIRKVIKPPIPSMEEIKPQKSAAGKVQTSAKKVIPMPSPLFTKVYLGSYVSLEDAMAVQDRISEFDNSLNPFIKAQRDTYIVQLGSFSEAEKAETLVKKLKANGYNPKIIKEN